MASSIGFLAIAHRSMLFGSPYLLAAGLLMVGGVCVGLPGAPLIGIKIIEDRLTQFLVPVSKWSDGSVAPMDER